MFNFNFVSALCLCLILLFFLPPLKGIIVGPSKTYGKGLVQKITPLPYDNALKYTIAKYYTPSGRCIQSVTYTGTVHRNQEWNKQQLFVRKKRNRETMPFYFLHNIYHPIFNNKYCHYYKYFVNNIFYFLSLLI